MKVIVSLSAPVFLLRGLLTPSKRRVGGGSSQQDGLNSQVRRVRVETGNLVVKNETDSRNLELIGER